MSAEALSSTKFQRVANHSARCKLRVVFGQGSFRPRAHRPVSHAVGGSSACVKLARSRRVSHDVSRESTRLTVEGIRNYT